MRDWVNTIGLSGDTVLQSFRTMVGSVASLLIARSLKLPEFYWAPISTIVILLSTTNPMTLAWQRFVGTALGAAVGAAIASLFQPNWLIYGAGIFVCGILSAILRLGSAYRFSAITLSVVLLIARGAPPWTVAFHRFVEVSVGIAVALVTTVVWRIPSSQP
jgi:uncharacterized membrane protein YccC